MASTTNIYKTCRFRIHNPTKTLATALDEALEQNHLSYQSALKVALLDIDHLSALDKKTRRETLQRRIAEITRPNRLLSTGAKIGIRSDVIQQVESYLATRKISPSVAKPSTTLLSRPDITLEQTLQQISTAQSLREIRDYTNQLFSSNNHGLPRPILFTSYRFGDGFMILSFPETTKYRIWLNLFPESSIRARNIKLEALQDTFSGQMVKINSKTGLLIPVELSEPYQKKTFIDKGRPKFAKLCKFVDDAGHPYYEVHVAYLFEPTRLSANTYLAVDRGINNLASLAVVGQDGAILHRENIDGRLLRILQISQEKERQADQKRSRKYRRSTRKALADEIIHKAANRIVQLAQQFSSRVVIENLSTLKPSRARRCRGGNNKILSRAQFGKLASILVYKLGVAGLPKFCKVGAAYTSQTCAVCGFCSRENRKKRPKDGGGFDISQFECVKCNFTDDADLNAAVVIGQKKRWRESLPNDLKMAPNTAITGSNSFEEFLRNSCRRA